MSSSRSVRPFASALRRMLLEDSGAFTVVAIVSFAMLVGIGALAVDLGRYYGVHGQMQAYVDNVALGGASELDGHADALTRSVRAIIGDDDAGPLVAGTQNFAEGDAELSIEKVSFLSVLGDDPGPLAITPTDDDVVLCVYEAGDFTPGGCDTDADVNNEVQYVEVVATERQVNYLVLPVVDVFRNLSGVAPIATSENVRLKATAGFVREVCNNTPLMICNPSEIGGIGEDFDFARGRQIRAKDGSWSPGNFGLLDTYEGNGAALLRDMMGKVNPNTQCVRDSATVKTGENTGPVQQGMNVRFDMYDGPMKGDENDAEYAPAANVTKGLTTNNGNCRNNRSAQTMPLPRDSCFMTPSSGCTVYDGVARFGDGNWSRNAYWSQNHPGVAQPPGYSTMTRYDVYRYEIEHPEAVNRDEKSGPTCSPFTADNPARDRRLLYVAIVNCRENPPSNNTPIKVEAYAEVFLTEPVGNTEWSNFTRGGITFGPADNRDIFLEMVDLIEPGDASGVLHVFPVLYR